MTDLPHNPSFGEETDSGWKQTSKFIGDDGISARKKVVNFIIQSCKGPS